MQVNDLALARGIGPTRATLARWNLTPGPVLRAWSLGSLAVAALLIGAVYLVALAMPADPTPLPVLGITAPPSLADVGQILHRNALVLALHAFACVAGFIALNSLPHSAANRSGISKLVHEKAGPYAMTFVAGATLFSLSTQAYFLGAILSSAAKQFGLSDLHLLMLLLPHAAIELTALFLPLAAWLIASRRGHWDQLLAATFVTVAVAIPLLLLAVSIEVYIYPELIRAAVL
jgi:hypothetical protein